MSERVKLTEVQLRRLVAAYTKASLLQQREAEARQELAVVLELICDGKNYPPTARIEFDEANGELVVTITPEPPKGD